MEYARDYSKFNREILFWLFLDLLFLDRVTMAAAACLIFGVWTLISGVINLNLVFIPIGTALIGLGVFLGRHVIRDFI